MKNYLFKKLKHSISMLILPVMFGAFALSCGNDDGMGMLLATKYSGTANLNFTGDTTLTFIGKVNNASIVNNNGRQIFPINYANDDGLQLLTLAIGDPNIQARTYTISGLGGEGGVTISLSDELYDAKSGTIMITTLNEQEVKGSIDVALQGLFSFNDDLFIKGTFELTAQ